jgi:hypothetical protein
LGFPAGRPGLALIFPGAPKRPDVGSG